MPPDDHSLEFRNDKAGHFQNPLSFVLLLTGLLGALFLAGGPVQGGMGIFLILAGVVLVSFKPAYSVPWIFWGLAALVLFASCSSLLPADWFTNPGWRMRLQGLPAFLSSGHVTLDPRATIFWIQLLAASILIILFLLGSPLSDSGMRRVALVAVLGAALYSLIAWIAWQTNWRNPFFIQQGWAQAVFGFFPNRNQTAGFLLSGAILSLGLIYQGIKGRGLLCALLASCAFALLISMLLFFSESRGGVVFLVLGVILWLAGLGKHGSRWLVRVIVMTAMVSLILFVNSGNELLGRIGRDSLHTIHIIGAGVQSEFTRKKAIPFNEVRISIWEDTLSLIKDYPVTGTGMGSYHYLYPFYADKSLRDRTTALHAESDWLMLNAEAGIPSFLLVLLSLGILMRRLPKLAEESGENWPLRWAFLSAFLIELVHGLVDVSLHKPELGWWLMILGGIGFASASGKDEGNFAKKIQRLLLISGGLGVILFGAVLIRAEWFGGEPLPPFAPAAEIQKITRLYGQGSPVELASAIVESRKALGLYPASYPLYYELAALRLIAREDPNESLALFAVENELSSNDAYALLEQGKYLLRASPEAAMMIWKEALRRQVKLDKLPSSPHARTEELFREILFQASKSPELSSRVSEFAALDSQLLLIWLREPQCDPALIAATVQETSVMEQLSPMEQGRVIALWYARGDHDDVEKFLNSHPGYGRPTIGTRAEILASSGQYEAACRLLADSFCLQDFVQQSPQSPMIHAAEWSVPDDPLAAAEYYFKLGNTIAAERLLNEAAQQADVNQREFLLMKARLYLHSGNWRDLYQLILDFLHATNQL